MFLPMNDVWSLDGSRSRSGTTKTKEDGGDGGTKIIVSIATIALKAQICWIYFDAGYGKYSDPLQGWTYHADPLPALDTYARHTVSSFCGIFVCLIDKEREREKESKRETVGL